MVAALAFVLSILFWPGISGGATSPRWALMSVAIPVLCLFTPTKVTVAHVLGVLFLLYAGASLAWTPNLVFGLNAYWQIILMAGAFAIGSAMASLRPVLIALGVGFSLNGLFVLFQFLVYDPFRYLETAGNPSIIGTFINGNLLAECASLTFIGLAAYGVWPLLPMLLPSIILPFTQSTPRAPIVAVGVSAITWLWWRHRRLLAAHLAGFALIIGLFSISSHNDSLDQRFFFWVDTLHGLKPFGHGIGSYYLTFPEFSAHTNTLTSRPENAHNDYLEAIYELGIGIIPLVYVIAIALRSRREHEKLILVGALTLSAFGFPLHMPMGQFMAALTLGCLCGDWLPVRASFAVGRIRVRAWVAGIANAARSHHPAFTGAALLSGLSTLRPRGRELLRGRSLEGVGAGSYRRYP